MSKVETDCRKAFIWRNDQLSDGIVLFYRTSGKSILFSRVMDRNGNNSGRSILDWKFVFVHCICGRWNLPGTMDSADLGRSGGFLPVCMGMAPLFCI